MKKLMISVLAALTLLYQLCACGAETDGEGSVSPNDTGTLIPNGTALPGAPPAADSGSR